MPLLTLFGASNELPEEEELTALYDRFLLRFVVSYIAEDFRFLRMLESQKTPQRTTLTLAELTELQHEVREITLPAHVYRSIADIRRELNKKTSRPRIAAIGNPYPCCKPMLTLEGETEVYEKHLFFLEHVLWRDPAEHEPVRGTIRELLLGYEEEITELLYESREIRDSALQSARTSDERARALIELHTKLRNILTKVDQIMEKASTARPALGTRAHGAPRNRATAKRHVGAVLMPPRRKPKAPLKRVFQPLPKNSFWIKNDAYDLRVWGHLRAESPSCVSSKTKAALSCRTLAHFCRTFFALLFKYNIIYHGDAEVLPSALLNQKFLQAIQHGAQYDFLREQTLLNEAHAGFVDAYPGERLLTLVREEKFLTRRDMRDLWDIQKQEELLGQKIEEYDNADTIPRRSDVRRGQEGFTKAKERMGGEVQGAEALLRHKTQH